MIGRWQVSMITSTPVLILCTFIGAIGNILLDINAEYFLLSIFFYDRSVRNIGAQSRLGLIFANDRQRLFNTKNRIIKTPASVAYFAFIAIKQFMLNTSIKRKIGNLL